MQKNAGVARGIAAAAAAALVTAALVMAGCTAANTLLGPGTTINTTSTLVPLTITDAPSDQVVAASLTLNSVVLTDAKGNTASILSAPLTFEAAHLDAVQEPLFTPSIPEDSYVGVSLTYSNAQVAYFDPTTKQLVLATATLANTSQTITFPTPMAVNNTTTSLLIDYLVANSVTISGSTVTVTPQFHLGPAPIAKTPTSGVNGLLCGIKGKVSALGTNQFTLTNAEGLTLTINVNGATQYQGLSGFSAMAVGALVEVDVAVQADSSLLALRIDEQVAPTAAAQQLVGPVVAVTGSPATSFTQLVRQKIGAAPTSTAVEKDTITVTGTTQWLLPGMWKNMVVSGVPFTPTFNASTLFAGQVVGVATNGVSNNAATATSVILAPQTVSGIITAGVAPACTACWANLTLTLPAGSWLATVTGKTTVTVLLPGNVQAITSATPVAGNTVRFNGFLFSNNGTLTLVAVVEGPAPGTAIGPGI
jgi:hypothetical protein